MEQTSEQRWRGETPPRSLSRPGGSAEQEKKRGAGSLSQGGLGDRSRFLITLYYLRGKEEVNKRASEREEKRGEVHV